MLNMEFMNRFSTIIVFGAGQKGKAVVSKCVRKWHSKIVCFCDNDINKHGKTVEGIPIYGLPEAHRLFPDSLYVIAVVDSKSQAEIRALLKAYVPDDHIINSSDIVIPLSVEQAREKVALGHITGMDTYFSDAESDEALDIFWGDQSMFYQMFKHLDLSSVVELACGRGRHVQKYIEKVGRVTLVDILEKNIALCKERFKDNPKIEYYQNNGYSLPQITDASVTALFTYDAMVHFEMMDIYSYLLETARILKPHGKALFHHSNNYSNYNAMFINAPGGRAFMSDKVFAHMATRAGLLIVEQKVIDWGVPNLDCITLVTKED